MKVEKEGRTHFTQGDAEGYLQTQLLSLEQAPLPADQAKLLAMHLSLLILWNGKINLTAIRKPEEMLRRHFIESILCARLLPPGIGTLLDYGSGGGFPGVPCAVCLPEVRVTLAESQARKAAFLREVLRSLRLPATVYHGRVEEMNPDTKFDAVTLRAVDRMPEACKAASLRVKTGGWLAVLGTWSSTEPLVKHISGITWNLPALLVGSKQGVLLLGRKNEGVFENVPRGIF